MTLRLSRTGTARFRTYAAEDLGDQLLSEASDDDANIVFLGQKGAVSVSVAVLFAGFSVPSASSGCCRRLQPGLLAKPPGSSPSAAASSHRRSSEHTHAWHQCTCHHQLGLSLQVKAGTTGQEALSSC